MIRFYFLSNKDTFWNLWAFIRFWAKSIFSIFSPFFIISPGAIRINDFRLSGNPTWHHSTAPLVQSRQCLFCTVNIWCRPQSFTLIQIYDVGFLKSRFYISGNIRKYRKKEYFRNHDWGLKVPNLRVTKIWKIKGNQ